MNYPRMRKLIGSLLGRTTSIEAPVSSPTPDPSSWIVESTPDYIPEGAAGRLLVDPRFWTAFFNVAFPWNSLDTNVVAEAIGLSDDDVLPWWHDLSGYYDGIFDESDGDLERPKTIAIPLEAGRQLDIELHAGSLRYLMVSREGARESLAVLDGHWMLPEFSWREIEVLASAAERRGVVPGVAVTLLLLPLGSPYANSDLDRIEPAVREATLKLGFASEEGAAALAVEWRRTATESDC